MTQSVCPATDYAGLIRHLRYLAKETPYGQAPNLIDAAIEAADALEAARSGIGLKPKEGHCLLQVPQQTPEKPSPCAIAGYCLKTTSNPSAIPTISASGNYPLKFFGSPGPIGTCMGIEIHADRAVSDHTIEVRDSINGRLLGRIINVG